MCCSHRRRWLSLTCKVAVLEIHLLVSLLYSSGLLQRLGNLLHFTGTSGTSKRFVYHRSSKTTLKRRSGQAKTILTYMGGICGELLITCLLHVSISHEAILFDSNATIRWVSHTRLLATLTIAVFTWVKIEFVILL